MKKNYSLFDDVLPVKEIRELQLSFYEEQIFTSEIIPTIDRIDRNVKDAAKVQRLPGTKIVQLQEAPAEPGIYYVTCTLEKVGERQLPERITSVQEAANATAYLSRYAVEHYDAIVTNKNGMPLAIIGSFKGAETQTSVFPATVLKELSKVKGAAHLWASHNHPSGVSELSHADIKLSEFFESLLRDSGVEYHGLIAICGKNFASQEQGKGVISEDIGRTLKVPVVERMIQGASLDHMMMSTPSASKTLVQQIAKDVPGIIFLSSQHAPVSFIPVNPNELNVLRIEGRFMRLVNAAASSGAVAAIIANPNNLIQTRPSEVGGLTAANNIAAALNAIDVRVLDVVSYDPLKPDMAVSEAERGTLNPAGKFFSKAIGPTNNPHNINTATTALLNAFTGSSKVSITTMFENGIARVITAQQARHLACEDALFMTAWHGSPHDYARFDLSQIGSGEGVQAYGHGLYFAGNREVAEYYQKTLGQAKGGLSDLLFSAFQERDFKPSEVKSIYQIATSDEFSIEKSVKVITNSNSGLRDIDEARLADVVRDYRKQSKGKLYKVDLLPEQEDYLLWDKPLIEQSEKVQSALKEMGESVFDAWATNGSWEHVKGESAYRHLAGGAGRGHNWKMAAEFLHQAGIRGIQYLDASSRSASRPGYRGDSAYLAAAKNFKENDYALENALSGLKQAYKTADLKELQAAINEAYDVQPELYYNYVIFDDKDITIIGKDGEDIAKSETSQIETEEFKAWFGDSKVITGNGKPKVLYHGTGADITVFDNSKASEKTDKNRDGAFWFSSAPEVAGNFAGEQSGERVPGGTLGHSNIVPVYLNVNNPFVDRYGRYARGGGLKKSDIEELEANGYDGVYWPQADVDLPDTTMDGPVQGYYRNRHGEAWGESADGYPDQWAAFHPEQIKSAIGNNGQFNSNNPDIRYSHDSSTRTLAFFNPTDGITYFIADHISKEFTDQEWRGLALHEIAVHAMQLGSNNEEFKSILNDFENMKEAGDEKVIDAFNKVPTHTGPENVLEEALAYYIQHNHEMPISQRFVAWMRGCIRAMGQMLPFTQRAPWSAWANKLTPNDLVYMAHAALSRNTETAQRDYVDGVALASKTNERFYSQLYKAMRDAPEKIFTNGEQVSAWLRANHGKNGVKKEEIYWTGIEDWLNAQGKVNKNDVLAFLNGNGVKVEEIILGGSKLDFPASYEDLPKNIQNLVDQVDNGSLDIVEFNEQAKDAGYYADVDMGGELENIYRIGAEGQPTKHHLYQLPGGENYRELLLTLPGKTQPGTKGTITFGNEREVDDFLTDISMAGMESLDYGAIEENGMRLVVEFDGLTFDQRAEFENFAKQYQSKINYIDGAKNAALFSSSHFDQPNVLAHIRFNERTDADDAKVLFIEEIQSDWGQQAKKLGFGIKDATPLSQDEIMELDKLYGMRSNRTVDETSRMHELNNRQNGSEGKAGIPQAPFVTDTKSWTALAMKRMISYAAENGFDKVAWTNGVEQAARYSLNKQVDAIDWKMVSDSDTGATRRVFVKTVKKEAAFTLRVNDAGVIVGERKDSLKGKQLSEVLGKEIAGKILGQEFGELHGDGLRLGGEGMKGFYDVIVPQVANSIISKKEYGNGKVESVVFNGNGIRTYSDLQSLSDEISSQVYGKGTAYASLPLESQAKVREIVKKRELNQPGFTITQELRNKVLNVGFPLFSVETSEPIHQRIGYIDKSQPLHIDDMHEEISRIKGQWPSMPPVHVINDVSELPFTVNKNARGIYSQNNIYIVAPKIFSIPELQKVMAHEYILHHSFFEMFDHYEFSKIHNGIQSLKERGDPAICKIAEHLAQVYDPLSPEDETREIIAHAGEECLDERGNIKKEYGFMRPVFANFTSWLRDHGIAVPFSNYELQGIIVNAGKYAQRENEKSLASLREKSGLYSGKILDVQGNMVIQKTGCNLTDIERHLFPASTTKPNIGEIVNITYKNKQPVVLTKEKSKEIEI